MPAFASEVSLNVATNKQMQIGRFNKTEEVYKMFPRNKVGSQQKGNRNFCSVLIGVLTSLILIGFCADLSDAYSVKPADEYKEIKAIYKDLRKQQKSEDLEKLVEKSRDFVTAHPEYNRVDEVYYLLGNALVQLERVDEGIKVFEKLIEDHPNAPLRSKLLVRIGIGV